MTRFRKEYTKIGRKLTSADLQSGISNEKLGLDNIVTDGRLSVDSQFFMGVFSRQGLLNAIRAFGLLDILEKKGLTDISIDIDTSDPYIQRLYAYSGTPLTENKICELVVKQWPLLWEDGLPPSFPRRNANVLYIEWLLLQNPRENFSAEKPPLPGQNYPGLGIGDRMMEILIIMTRRLNLEGIVNKPHYFHTAFMFSKEFVFINPYNQALMYAISKELLSKYSFWMVAWAAHFNCIVNKQDGKPLDWKAGDLILPFAKDLIKYFRGREYQQEVNRLIDNFNFEIELDKLHAALKSNDLEKYARLPK
ncbi:MAG TPA: hypothetical protein P5268_04180 [Candidatus Marinimicrobia bacterium]|nr:hypothetical protein [Candidatus Neomarinimicrobiota bacterium]HRS51408.1 hypothetical protein [Candidatus Neomarinimicrobiota bacterium]HRU92220.1 hypothetical protein [Candidatus Neomarinimicrobiota bacterium]